MTSIDYDALRGQSGGDPLDGIHEAYLMRAALVDTSQGSRLVTEWQTFNEPRYYWTTWFGFEGNRLQFTQEFLDALGIDRATLMNDDAFESELSKVQGTVYQVRTEAGAAWINTYVEDAAQVAAQTDLPIDTADLPPTPPPPGAPTPAGVGAGTQNQSPADDDDIPF